MTKRLFLVLVVLMVPTISGCFVEPGSGGSVEFDGSFNVSDREFTMNGQVRLGGGIPPQDEYRDIQLELYAKNGSLLYKENLGTLHNRSERLDVSVSLSTVPHYVIFDSPDIWDGETEVDYYVRSPEVDGGYRFEDTTDRSQLPITPDG